MADDEFTIMINDKKYEVALKLKDARAIEMYKSNPEGYTALAQSYVSEFISDLTAPEEVRESVMDINLRRKLEKFLLGLSLFMRVENPDEDEL